jgi:type IV pilus assembly protein PilB
MRDFQILPLSIRGSNLVMATADPTLSEVQEKIKFTSQMPVDWVIAEADKLKTAVTGATKSTTESLKQIVGNEPFDFGEIAAASADEPPPQEDEVDEEDAPIVRFLHKMLVDAIEMKASDLHFEPYEFSYRVRYRVDGELREIVHPPVAIKEKLASRIKVISRMDISEKRVPQDGRMKLRISADKVIDFRVSTLPTLFGEKIVIRILDPSSATLGIEALGYEPEEKKRLLDAIARPYGMILVTGPTGSGKTVSLYTCLNLLNKPEVNISTAEDPAEINMPGINQVNVNEKAGLTFAAALRSFLRQDPDIIMVGEIRDLETADIAIKAAQTGHLVMSTLHTNDAPTTLTRLRNMGVAPFNIASSVLLITAQRLARRLCPKCKTPANIPRQTLVQAGFRPDEIDGTWQPYRPVGCPACNNGYKGRVGIYQVMPISEEIQRLILSDGTAMDIEAQTIKEGIRTLRQSGLVKVKAGLTSLEEVEGCTNE